MHFSIRTRSASNKYNDKKPTNSTLNLDTTGLFRDSRLRIRCFAEITPVYKASALIEITEERPYLASITGDASPHSRQSDGCSQVILISFWSHKSAVLVLSLFLNLLIGTVSTR
ncbi:PREDICTED: uncharacterized protein LOC105368226 [Ceratosolen solmsi marchali]|uniref:Uncharacterized protein LOC105368226 n=1 Tax=Ceratosolen solmsi marchali TaxID=326594 RepID=A0AAJ6YW26_9HYME|nr:PREDICTED: uncharacterized protein LOC105368226 [Ceratosolen solmsi marchali]